MIKQREIEKHEEKNAKWQLMVFTNIKNFYKDQSNQLFIFTKA